MCKVIENLPTKQQEIRLPVIICPFCGEKDPMRLALRTVNRETTLLNDNGFGFALVDPSHEERKVEIDGTCITCQTEFNISIIARVPWENVSEKK